MLTIRPAVTTAPLLLRLARDRQIYDTNPAIRLPLESRRVRAEQFTPPPIARFTFRFFVSKPILIDDRANRDGLRPSVPVPAGGMSAARVSEMLDFYGADVMLLIGGALLEARAHLIEATAAFVAEVHGYAYDAQSREPLKDTLL